MYLISMDFIGEFYPRSSAGNIYSLTVICMLTGYTFCIPIKSKSATDLIRAYIDHVYCKFAGLINILSDNGTKFKEELFSSIAKQLGVEHKVYAPLYHLQSNETIEGFHVFLKASITKHVPGSLD